MNWKWRAAASGLLLAGTVVWLPMAVTTNAAAPLGSAGSVVRGPVADDNADNSGDDNGSSDNGSSDNGNANNNDNTSGNSNNNNNDNTSGNNNNNNNDNNSTGVT